MFLFSAKSIKQRLLKMNLVAIGVALVLTMMVVMARDMMNFMEFITRDLRVQAKIIGNSSSASLAFLDEKAAKETLSLLSGIPQIVEGAIFTSDWRVFATYGSFGDKILSESDKRPDGYIFGWRTISFFEPVYLKGQRLGTVLLVSDTTSMYYRLLMDVFLLVCIAVLGLVISSFLFSKFQRSISDPILSIVETMQVVAKNKNYSLRVPVLGDDELTILANEFNAMLENLQGRDREIQDHRANLENLIQKRTVQWEESNLSLEIELNEHRRTEWELREKSYELTHISDDLKHALLAEKRFIATMSHEMRTPLNAIIGFIEVLLTTRLGDYQRRLLETVQSSSNHLLSLICDVLDVSKIESGQMELSLEPVDLREIISQSLTLAAPRVKSEVRLRHEIPNFDFSILGDARRIKQIFLNILGNAAKFTEKGTIGFSLCKSENVGREKVRLTFSVKDTGLGIPKIQQESLFLPFRQLNHGKEGSGLGLFISLSLSQMMGGGIEVHSREGEGTQVLISFVFQKAPPLTHVSHPPTVLASGRNHFKNLKLLLVEDLEVNISVAKELLITFFGITQFDVARNGLEAVELTKTNTYDLIFMDIQMPVMDGITATREIRAAKVGCPIVAMSADAFLEEIEAAKAAGMNDYITKPVKMENMYAAFQAFFGKISAIAADEEMKEVSESGGDAKVMIYAHFMSTFHSPETAQRLLRISSTSISSCLKAIHEGLLQKDFQALEASLHKIHGALLNCGLQEASDSFARLHGLARKKSALEEIEQTVNDLEKQLLFTVE